MKIKYDHKPPQRLYMKIFVGYFLLIGLVLTAAALVYMEYRNIECAVQEEEQTAERWKQANRTFETMYDLAMSELHTFTADKEDYEEYELKNLAAQQMLDSLKRLYPEEKQLERIDSAKSILAEKSLQVLCMMRTFNDLAHMDSLIECQIREMTLVEQKAIRELKKNSEQKKDSWIGRLFKKKSKKQEPVEQATESRTQAVGRLTKLRKEISEKNEDLRLRMEMQTDSHCLKSATRACRPPTFQASRLPTATTSTTFRRMKPTRRNSACATRTDSGLHDSLGGQFLASRPTATRILPTLTINRNYRILQ